MYDRMASRYLEHFDDDYELSEEQYAQMEAELEKVKAEHKAYIEPMQEELDSLFRRMREAMDERREGGDWDRDAMREIGRRMYEIRSGSPLMSFGSLRERLEGMLPAEQVERGREKQEERWERRREFWRERGVDWEERRREWQRDEWERYYDQFIEVYDLDESQKASAGAIYRDCTTRRDAYLADKKDAFARVEELEDRGARREEREKLDAPVDQMFEELKMKLNQIPTAAQKELAQAERAAQTRPAGEREDFRRERPNREARYGEGRSNAESESAGSREERDRGARARGDRGRGERGRGGRDRGDREQGTGARGNGSTE